MSRGILEGAANNAGQTGIGSTHLALGGTTDEQASGVPPVETVSHAAQTITGTLLPTPRERCAIARSLLGHRVPTAHLCKLITAAMNGASWEDIYALDADR